MKLSEQELIELIIRRMRADKSIEPPADAVKYAKDIFRTRISQKEPGPFRRLVAVLKSDLGSGRAVFGERSTGAAKARQVLFEAGENAVDLRITPKGRGFTVHGQVLGAGLDECDVSIADAKGDIVMSVTTGAMGDFRFEKIDAGEYSLHLRGKNSEIVIEQLRLA